MRIQLIFLTVQTYITETYSSSEECVNIGGGEATRNMMLPRMLVAYMFLPLILNKIENNKNEKNGKYVWSVSNLHLYILKKDKMYDIHIYCHIHMFMTTRALKWDKRINITKWIYYMKIIARHLSSLPC